MFLTLVLSSPLRIRCQAGLWRPQLAFQPTAAHDRPSHFWQVAGGPASQSNPHMESTSLQSWGLRPEGLVMPPAAGLPSQAMLPALSSFQGAADGFDSREPPPQGLQCNTPVAGLQDNQAWLPMRRHSADVGRLGSDYSGQQAAPNPHHSQPDYHSSSTSPDQLFHQASAPVSPKQNFVTSSCAGFCCNTGILVT